VAAGALAGYALANSNNHSQPAAPAPQYQQPAPQYQQPAPQYQQQAPAYADQAPAPAPAPVYTQAAPAPAPAYAPAAAPAPAYAAAPQSSGGFGFGSFLLLLALIGACIFGYRRYVMRKGDIQADARRTGNAAKASVDAFKSSFNAPAPAASAKPAVDMGKATSNFASEAELDRVGQDLMATAEQFYKELQDLNNKGDLNTLRNRIGDDGLFNDLADAVRTRTTPSQTEVVSLQADLVDLSDEGNRFVGSVRYQGMVKEGPYQAAEGIDEVFHFVKDKGVLGSWKLAGIEQVEEA
jgi:predicted lipid-binding transport protein (Tim44 family)